MTIYDRIKLRREELGMSQQELAYKLGYKSRSTINKIELGLRDINQSKISEFAIALSTTPAYLMGWEEPAEVHATNMLPLPKRGKKPLLGTIACGEPLTAVQNIEEYVVVPTDVKCDFAVRCEGDSMIDARIYDGDIIYVKEQPDVENGEIAVVLIDNQSESRSTLKRVYKDDNQITLIPANPKYQPLVFIGNATSKIRILGKAVAFTSKVI